MIRSKVMSIGLMAMLSGWRAGAQSATVSAVDAKPGCASQVRSTYLLGPEDQLQITGADLDEPVGKLVGVDGEGDIQVPLVGRVHVAGLTVQQAEKEMNSRLAKFIKNPQVALDVKEMRSQPVSIGGPSEHAGRTSGFGSQDATGNDFHGRRDEAGRRLQHSNHSRSPVGLYSAAWGDTESVGPVQRGASESDRHHGSEKAGRKHSDPAARRHHRSEGGD